MADIKITKAEVTAATNDSRMTVAQFKAMAEEAEKGAAELRKQFMQRQFPNRKPIELTK